MNYRNNQFYIDNIPANKIFKKYGSPTYCYSARKLQNNIACAIIVIDHDLKFIMGVCDKITVMNMGEVIASGKPNEISNNKRVKEAYIGH